MRILLCRPDHQNLRADWNMVDAFSIPLSWFRIHSWVRLHVEFCRLLRSNRFAFCETYRTNNFSERRALLRGSGVELVRIHNFQIWIWCSHSYHDVSFSHKKRNNIYYSRSDYKPRHLVFTWIIEELCCFRNDDFTNQFIALFEALLLCHLYNSLADYLCAIIFLMNIVLTVMQLIKWLGSNPWSALCSEPARLILPWKPPAVGTFA